MTFVLDHIGFDVGGVRVIDDVCLTFQPASLNVLLGPTLAGKTTIMRLMAGLDQPATGSLLHDGQDVTGTPVRKRWRCNTKRMHVSLARGHREFVDATNWPARVWSFHA